MKEEDIELIEKMISNAMTKQYSSCLMANEEMMRSTFNDRVSSLVKYNENQDKKIESFLKEFRAFRKDQRIANERTEKVVKFFDGLSFVQKGILGLGLISGAIYAIFQLRDYLRK